MRKSLKAILLGAALMALLCVSTLAAEAATTGGFYDVNFTKAASEGVTITVQNAAGTAVAGVTANVIDAGGEGVNQDVTLHPDSARLNVVFDGTGVAAGDEVVVMLVTGNALPTAENAICYINQIAKGAGDMTFNVFPILPTATGDLTLYITSNADGFETIAIDLGYAIPPYPLGDVDKSGSVNAIDATVLLQYTVGLVELDSMQITLADVDVNGTPTAVDATYILQYTVGIVEDFADIKSN